MNIGGQLSYSGNTYFVNLLDVKNRMEWYLYSELHREDRERLYTGAPLEYDRLNLALAQRRPIPQQYLLESVRRKKSSGQLGMFRGRLVLSEVLQTLQTVLAYSFATEYVYENEIVVEGGEARQFFEARDSRAYLRYRKRNGYYVELMFSYDGMELNMKEDVRIRLDGSIDYEDIKEKVKGKLVVNTVSSLDYASLCQILDMSWYEKDGKVLKDYRAITTIDEFERYVMDDLIAEYYRCIAAGEEFILSSDTETTGLVFYYLSDGNDELDHMVAIPLAWKDHQGVVIFIAMEWFNNIPLQYVLERLRSFFATEKITYTIPKRKVMRHVDPAGAHVLGTNAVELDDGDETWEDVGTYTIDRAKVNLVGHNILFDGRVFYHYKFDTYWDDDTLQMAFDLNPKVAKGSNKLKNLTRRIFGHETPELSDILGKGNEGKYNQIRDLRVAVIYGCADADYTRLVRKHLRSLMSDSMFTTYRKQDMRPMNRLFISEYYGMNTNHQMVLDRADIVTKDLQTIREFLYEYVGRAVAWKNQKNVLDKQFEVGLITKEARDAGISNIKVDKATPYVFEFKGAQIRNVLFEILEYKPKSWTQGKKRMPSVDKFAMQKLLKDKWPVPRKALSRDIYSCDPRNKDLPDDKKIKLINAKAFNSFMNPVAYVLSIYGTMNKEWTSYYKPIIEQNLEGRIFKGYSLARIETRRIMNPGQTMKGDLKALIIPHSSEYYLVDFDQSQVEYRIMASLSGFQLIIDKMCDPEKDYHTETAAAMHNIPPHKVSKKMRKQGKGVSFGVPYGLGLPRMTENLNDGETSEELEYQTGLLLDAYNKANAPIIKMLETYRDSALEPVDLPPALRKFIKLKEDDPDDIPYGMVKGLMGFYRLFDLRDLDRQKRGKIRRPAGNYPIQNFAAELFRIILMQFYERCKAEGIENKIIWHMLIHDELLFSAHNTVHPILLYKILFETCVVQIKGHTKYFIGINIGDTWADCKEDLNEAPIHFVSEMVARWDAGEFRDDDYMNAVYHSVNGKGVEETLRGPKAYVLKHKHAYLVNRIHEVLSKEVQTDIDTAPIDVKKILAGFSNYAVRAYVSDYFPTNSPYPEGDSDAEFVSRLETWAMEKYGPGKFMRYADGGVRKIQVGSVPTMELDIDALLNRHADSEYSEGWSFDEDEFGEAQNDLTSEIYYVADENEEELYLQNFHTDGSVEGARSVVDLLVRKEPTYKHIQVLYGQIVINVQRTKHVDKLKALLLPSTSTEGNSILFKTPTTSVRWQRIPANYDLHELDKVIEGLV